MHRIFRTLSIFIMGCMLAACSEPGSVDPHATLDTSSSEAMEASIEAMTAGMSDEQQSEFGAALAGIMMIKGLQTMGQNLSDAETRQAMLDELHGLTAAEIIAKAEAMKAELESR